MEFLFLLLMVYHDSGCVFVRESLHNQYVTGTWISVYVYHNGTHVFVCLLQWYLDICVHIISCYPSRDL